MSDFFYSLEQDLSGFLYTVNQNISKLSTQPYDLKEASISDSQQQLRESEKCLKQMEIETMPFPESVRREMNQRIRKHKADYEEVRRKFMMAEENFLDEKGKSNLMGNRYENNDYSQPRRPETLMEQQNRKLEDAKRTGFATLEIASNTNTELNRQTEVLLRNQDRLRTMDGDLGESNSLIKSMQRKVLKNKLTLYAVLAVIALAVGLIIYSYVS